MGEFRWQFRLRSMLVLVVIAALLMSAGLWGWKMRQRWVTNLELKSFYQDTAKLHAGLGSADSEYANELMRLKFEYLDDKDLGFDSKVIDKHS